MPDELPERVILQEGGRITLPDKMRKELEIKPGSVLELQRQGKSAILLTVMLR